MPAAALASTTTAPAMRACQNTSRTCGPTPAGPDLATCHHPASTAAALQRPHEPKDLQAGDFATLNMFSWSRQPREVALSPSVSIGPSQDAGGTDIRVVHHDVGRLHRGRGLSVEGLGRQVATLIARQQLL